MQEPASLLALGQAGGAPGACMTSELEESMAKSYRVRSTAIARTAMKTGDERRE
jgi:hypothetical protein